jgi:hypothetical protein
VRGEQMKNEKKTVRYSFWIEEDLYNIADEIALIQRKNGNRGIKIAHVLNEMLRDPLYKKIKELKKS